MSTATATKTATELPTIRVGAIRNAIDLDHYSVAAYDSIEEWQQKIVVVMPDLDGPTWVLRPGARSVNRRNIMALAVPTLEALTLDLAQRLTNMGTDYITVRVLPADLRRQGRVRGTTPVRMPWTR